MEEVARNTVGLNKPHSARGRTIKTAVVITEMKDTKSIDQCYDMATRHDDTQGTFSMMD